MSDGLERHVEKGDQNELTQERGIIVGVVEKAGRGCDDWKVVHSGPPIQATKLQGTEEKAFLLLLIVMDVLQLGGSYVTQALGVVIIQ